MTLKRVGVQQNIKTYFYNRMPNPSPKSLLIDRQRAQKTRT